MNADKEDQLRCVDGFRTDEDGFWYRPLATGELRQVGDVFFAHGKPYPELKQYLGTPQPRVEKDDFMTQSYRQTVRAIGDLKMQRAYLGTEFAMLTLRVALNGNQNRKHLL